MKDFCKVFKFDGIGQVVVMRTREDGDSSVSVTIHGGSVSDCVGAVTTHYQMDDELLADNLFDSFDESKAHETAGWVINEIEEKLSL